MRRIIDDTALLLALLFCCALACPALCGGRSLRGQVATLRAQQLRDRERLEALERSVLGEQAREERSTEQVPGWLAELLEDLSREISDVAAELRHRTNMEEMLEALQARQEQTAGGLRRLADSVKVLHEQQKNILHGISDFNETDLPNKETVAADHWNEEGSGDFEEAALIPIGGPRNPVHIKELNVVKKYVSEHFKELKRQQNLKLKAFEQHVESRLLHISNAVQKVQEDRNQSTAVPRGLVESVTTDLVEGVSRNLTRVSQQVSRVQFNAAQFQAALDVLQRDWAADNKQVKQLQEGLAATQRRLESQSRQLLQLEVRATNLSLQRCQREGDSMQRQLKMQNLETRLQQTDLRVESWVRQSDAHRTSSRNTLYKIQGHVANISEKAAALNSQLQEARADLDKFIRKLPKGCSSAVQSGSILIQIQSRPTEVYCDPGDRPWLLVQRRADGSLNFFRNWTDYKRGFSDPAAGEFWIGNEVLHQLTNTAADTALRVDMWDALGRHFYAEYEGFRVRSEAEQYSLELGEFVDGNVTDSLAPHAGMGFSTFDRDNDASSAHCALHHTGGWWYQHCHRADLNGRYPLGMTWYDGRRHDWLQLQRTEMKIAPVTDA